MAGVCIIAYAGAPPQVSSTRRLQDNRKPKMCRTPSGFHPCECVHSVASGTRVEDRPDVLRLHHPDGTTKDLAPCPHSPPPRRPPPPRSPPRNQSKPCSLGWPHAAPLEAFYQHSRDIAEFSATYTVPDPPASTASNILYYWIGLQDLNSSANPVIQPVLSYVRGSSSDNWYFASWNWYARGGVCARLLRTPAITPSLASFPCELPCLCDDVPL